LLEARCSLLEAGNLPALNIDTVSLFVQIAYFVLRQKALIASWSKYRRRVIQTG